MHRRKDKMKKPTLTIPIIKVQALELSGNGVPLFKPPACDSFVIAAPENEHTY